MFCKGEYGVYACLGHRVLGMVSQDGEFWRSAVSVDGRVVDTAEWDGLSAALRNAKSAMSRACYLRRFEKDQPTMPDGEDSDEDDDDDD